MPNSALRLPGVRGLRALRPARAHLHRVATPRRASPATACTRRRPSRCRNRACAGCRIDISGVSSSRSPLMGEAKVTPSSRTLRSGPRLNTWKPPESVRIGAFQPMKRCRPPCAAMTSRPGRSHRWNVLPRTICAPDVAQLVRRHRLDRAVSADRHEHRRLDAAVRQRERAAARAAATGADVKFHRADCSASVVGARRAR